MCNHQHGTLDWEATPSPSGPALQASDNTPRRRAVGSPASSSELPCALERRGGSLCASPAEAPTPRGYPPSLTTRTPRHRTRTTPTVRHRLTPPVCPHTHASRPARRRVHARRGLAPRYCPWCARTLRVRRVGCALRTRAQLCFFFDSCGRGRISPVPADKLSDQAAAGLCLFSTLPSDRHGHVDPLLPVPLLGRPPGPIPSGSSFTACCCTRHR